MYLYSSPICLFFLFLIASAIAIVAVNALPSQLGDTDSHFLAKRSNPFSSDIPSNNIRIPGSRAPLAPIPIPIISRNHPLHRPQLPHLHHRNNAFVNPPSSIFDNFTNEIDLTTPPNRIPVVPFNTPMHTRGSGIGTVHRHHNFMHRLIDHPPRFMDQLSERLAEVAAGTAENVVVGDGAGHLMNDTHDQENRDPNVSQQVLGGQVHHQPGPAAPSPIDIPTTTPSRRRARIPSTASSSLQSEDQVLMNQENITPPHRIIHTNNNNNNDNPPPIPRRRQRRRVVLGELDLEQPNSSPDSHSPTPLHRPLIRAHATHHLPLNRQLFNSPAVRRVVDWDMELAASELDHAASESESEEDGVTMVDEEEAMSLLSHQDSFAHSFGDHEDDEDVDERDLISFAELELQDREISHWPPTSHAIAFPLSSSPSSEESSVASSIGSHGVATNSSSGGEEEYQIIDDDEDERDDYMYDQLHDTVDGDEKTLVNSISPSFSVPRK